MIAKIMGDSKFWAIAKILQILGGLGGGGVLKFWALIMGDGTKILGGKILVAGLASRPRLS